MARVRITRSPRRILRAVYESVKTTFKSILGGLRGGGGDKLLFQRAGRVRLGSGGEPKPEQGLCGRSQTQSTADWLKHSSPVSVPVGSVGGGERGLAAQGGLAAVQVPIFITSCEYASGCVPSRRDDVTPGWEDRRREDGSYETAAVFTEATRRANGGGSARPPWRLPSANTPCFIN